MSYKIMHVYRNTPLGRETLMQAADFAKKIDGQLRVYLPKYDRFLFYFNSKAVEIRLDPSYLYLPEQAQRNLLEVLRNTGFTADLVEPVSMPASNLPRLATDFDILSLPRVMVERHGKMQIGAIGAGVRQLIKNATSPALISPGRFHDWREILVLFGGSDYSLLALKWGLAIAQKTDVPLNLLSSSEHPRNREFYEQIVIKNQMPIDRINHWNIIAAKSPVSLLNEIPRTSLVLMGAYGHGRIKARLFGSTTELIQRNTANLIMLIGEQCHEPGV